MKKQLLIVSVLACLFVSKNSFSQEKNEKVESLDEIIITATKFETNKKMLVKLCIKLHKKLFKIVQEKLLWIY